MDKMELIWFAGYVVSMVLSMLTASDSNKKVKTREAIMFIFLSFFSWVMVVIVGGMFLYSKVFNAEDKTVLSTREKNALMKKRYRWWY